MNPFIEKINELEQQELEEKAREGDAFFTLKQKENAEKILTIFNSKLTILENDEAKRL